MENKVIKDIEIVSKIRVIREEKNTEVLCDYKPGEKISWERDGPFHREWIRIVQTEPESIKKIYAEMMSYQYSRDLGRKINIIDPVSF